MTWREEEATEKRKGEREGGWYRKMSGSGKAKEARKWKNGK